MANTNRNLRDGALTVMVAACMLFCAFSPAILNWNEDDASASEPSDDDTFRYVSLGDSMTNAYGSIDYYYYDEVLGYWQTCLGALEDDTFSYTNLLARDLEEYLGDVDFRQLAVGGFRSEELRALLYDDFTQDYLKGEPDLEQRIEKVLRSPNIKALGIDDRESLEAYFRESLINADLITYQYLYDIGTPLFEPLRVIFANGNVYDIDFSRYIGTEYGPLVEYVFDYVSALINSYLESAGLSDLSSYASLVTSLAEGAAYGVVAYCANFDANMEWLYEVGYDGKLFDGKVIVLDSYNNYGGLVFDIMGISIPFGEVLDALFDISNFYVKNVSKWSTMVYHADVDEHPDMMYNEFTNGVEISEDAKAVLLQSVFNLLDTAIGLENTAYSLESIYGIDAEKLLVHDYNRNMTLFVEDFARVYDELDFNGKLTEFLGYAFDAKSMDFMEVFGLVLDGGFAFKLINTFDYLRDDYRSSGQLAVDIEFDNGSCTVKANDRDDIEFSHNELATVFITLNLLAGDNPMSHPSQKGHEYLYECVLKARLGGDHLNLNFDPSGDYEEVYFGDIFANYDVDDDVRTLPEIVSELSQNDFAAIAGADLVHIYADAGNYEFLVGELSGLIMGLYLGELNADTIRGTYEPMDYSDYSAVLGDDVVVLIDMLREKVMEYLSPYLMNYVEDEVMSLVASIVIDRVVYAYVGSLTYTVGIMSMVESINSDASFLVYGAYNRFAGMDFPLPGIPLDEALDSAYMAYNYVIYQICNVKDNAAFVDVYGATDETLRDVFTNGAQSWIVNENAVYDVKWVTCEGIRVDTVSCGVVPMYGVVPVPEGTDDYVYEFAGWDKEVVMVTEDVTYTAVYRIVPVSAPVDGYITIDVSAFDSVESAEISADGWSAAIPSAVFDGLEGEVSVGIKVLEGKDVPKDIAAVVGDRKVVCLDMTVGGVEVSDFGDNVVTVSFCYSPEEGMKMDNISVFWIDEANDRIEEYPAVYDAETGEVTFKTTHFSYWYVDEKTVDDDGDSMPYIVAFLVILALICAAYLRMKR